MMNVLKSKKTLAFMGVLALYALMVNINMVQRTRILADTRELAKSLGGTECTIEPIAEHITVPANATKTLLASYPGSGKRFSWNVISALSNHAVADDWNFSGNLERDTLSIKTNWPHKEGVWSWGSMMDQVILLVRNPRWAIPSYHTLRYELDYSSNWGESYLRVPYTYTVRPAIGLWENWRDIKFRGEMDRWADYIDFWMTGGISDGELHPRCANSDITCKPQTVIDFDIFYSEHPTSEFFKLSNVLDTVQNVEMIAAAARFCLLDKIFDETSLHNANRNGNGPVASAFTFTIPQLEYMLEKTRELRDKYNVAPWTSDQLAIDLVFILDNYINQIDAEYQFEIGNNPAP